MRISGLVVCVDYADLLAPSLELWRDGLDDLLTVTTAGDRDTVALCRSSGVDWYETDAFTRDGCAFNKGLALSEAVERIDRSDWVLNIDADIVPPADWRALTEAAGPVAGYLYGCPRTDEAGRPIVDSELASYFHLWHGSDPRVQRTPLWDVGWRHAGGYDSEFSFRWGPSGWRRLPFTVRHLGRPGENWWGRGNRAEHENMMSERRRRGGLAPCERLDGKTRIDWR